MNSSNYISIRIWAIWKTAGTICRYIRGTRERINQGQTPQQASDRAWREELRRVNDEHDAAMNDLELRSRQLDRIRKELESK